MKTINIIVILLFSFSAKAETVVSYSGYLTLIETCYFEGRNQDTLGKKAIVQTVINRKHDNRYPNTIMEVVYSPKQFSYTSILDRKIRDKESYEACRDAVNTTIKNPTVHKYTHYWACKGNWGISTPKWAKGLDYKEYGDHCYVNAK